MKQLAIFILALSFTTTIALAQKTLTVIKAHSKMVSIREGEQFNKDGWTISPEIKPDIHVTSNKNQKVTFITDIDSISFVVKENGVYDFIILLNGKDSALTQIKYEPSKLDILKKAAAYNLSDNTPFPKFTYQSEKDSNLVALRKGFNLDSVAGEGNDVFKIINLLHWVHTLVPHDGSSEIPAVKNAMSLIRECKAGKRGLNCRGLATVLNECFLSIGIKSRFITCMPKDSVFDDCHVINMVFSKSLNKWLWIDPTTDSYVMNEKGELLSVEEVRERMISGKTLILNPDANWNHKIEQTKEDYLYRYMAKNLYRIECPINSEYNTETKFKGQVGQYVELLPIDAFNQNPKVSRHTFENTGTTFVNYRTNNPTQFWLKPE